MRLIDVYNDNFVTKEAEESTDEANEAEEILGKYAELAESALKEEYGEDFEVSDVEKLAELMIEHDLYQEELEEKVAEYIDAGTIMARAFKAELENDN